MKVFAVYLCVALSLYLVAGERLNTEDAMKRRAEGSSSSPFRRTTSGKSRAQFRVGLKSMLSSKNNNGSPQAEPSPEPLLEEGVTMYQIGSEPKPINWTAFEKWFNGGGNRPTSCGGNNRHKLWYSNRSSSRAYGMSLLEAAGDKDDDDGEEEEDAQNTTLVNDRLSNIADDDDDDDDDDNTHNNTL